LEKTITSLLRYTYPTDAGADSDDEGEEDTKDIRENPRRFWPFDPNLRLAKFMIGKTSGPRKHAFRTAVTGRFKKKYYEPGYTHICVMTMFDAYQCGVEGETLEKLALDIESDLRSKFVDHVAFDRKLSNHGSGSVCRINVDYKWYGVYIAMKLEPKKIFLHRLKEKRKNKKKGNTTR